MGSQSPPSSGEGCGTVPLSWPDMCREVRLGRREGASFQQGLPNRKVQPASRAGGNSRKIASLIVILLSSGDFSLRARSWGEVPGDSLLSNSITFHKGSVSIGTGGGANDTEKGPFQLQHLGRKIPEHPAAEAPSDSSLHQERAFLSDGYCVTG